MTNLPDIPYTHKICVVCEGYEDTKYFNRLLELNVWQKIYSITPKNALAASNIVAMYENIYQNNSYELTLIFCDTDKYPFKEYSKIKEKIIKFHGSETASAIIIYANPCTMQIILSHFGNVLLKNQGKKTNSKIIEKFTGVANYDAHKEQIEQICSKIYQRTYFEMKARIEVLNNGDEVSASTNFIEFLKYFENNDASWIDDLNKKINN